MAQDQQTGGGIELVTLTDPNENAFTVQLPRGWRNQAYMARPHGAPRSVVNSTSPDGAVFLFWGDPQMPAFTEPSAGMFGMPSMNPLQQVHSYVPAEPFFLDYVRQRYGRAPGFRITANDGRSPEMEQSAVETSRRYNMPIQWLTSFRLSFEYADQRGAGTLRARFLGTTISLGPSWAGHVIGAIVSGGGDPAGWDGFLFHIGGTYQTNPRWRQMQDQQHGQRMAQIGQDHQAAMQRMQVTHQANMSWIDESARAHQQRMDSLHASADAQLQGWYAQQAAGDAAHQGYMDTLRGPSAPPGYGGPGSGDVGDSSHRRALNMVMEQETVVGPDGATYQVEGGHERYYRHKTENTYVGTDSTVERDDLRSRYGVNPDDWEEVRIRR